MKMKDPYMLGIDIDNGVPQLLSVLSILRQVTSTDVEIYMTTSKGDESHFHIETTIPTSIIMRRFLGDDPERVEWAMARRSWNGRPPDFLGNSNRKRIKLQIPIGV